MASQSKKNKARNSYFENGCDKMSIEECKCRGSAYFTKRDRNLNKRRLDEQAEEDSQDFDTGIVS